MSYDQTRYQALVVRAALRWDFYTGTFQDQSLAQRATTLTGCTWVRQNNAAWLAQRANGDGTATGTVAAIADMTGAFWIEVLFNPHILIAPSTNHLLNQSDAAGGFQFMWDVNNTNLILYLMAGGAGVRSIATPVGSVVPNRPMHAVIASIAGGTAGAVWVNGVPAVATLGLAGVAANIAAPTAILSGPVSQGQSDRGIIRTWTGTVSNEDVAALWGSCRDNVWMGAGII